MAAGKNESDGKLNWLYSDPSSLINREDYLLGKAVDKNFEKSQEKNENSETDRFAKPSVSKETSNVQVDISTKLHEDPLFAIRQKEIDARKELLNNPVKLKQMQEMLNKQKNDAGNSGSSDLNIMILKLLKKLGTYFPNFTLEKILTTRASEFVISETESESDGGKQKNKKHSSGNKKKKKTQKEESSSSSSDSEDSRCSKDEDSDSKDNRHRTGDDSDSKDNIRRRDEASYSKDNRRRRDDDFNSKDNRCWRDDDFHNKDNRHRRDDNFNNRDNRRGRDEDFNSKDNRHRRDDDFNCRDNRRRRDEDFHREDNRHRRDKDSDNKDYRHRRDKDRSKSQKNEDRNQVRRRNAKDSSEDERSGRFNKRRTSESENERSNRRKDSKTLRDVKKTGRETSSRKRKNAESSSSSSSSSEDSDSNTSGKPRRKKYGLVMPDGSKPVITEHRKTEKLPVQKPKVVEQDKYMKPKREALTEEETERKLKEMMENAKWRNKERVRNVERYKEEERRSEKERNANFDEEFARKQFSKATEKSTMSERLKSNLNNIQRSKAAMEKNFARR